MTLQTITNIHELDMLADRILDGNRRYTIVIISVTFAMDRACFDPDMVADALADTDARVVFLPRGNMGSRLRGMTNNMAVAYNGAAAILPASGRPRTVVHTGETSVDYLLDAARRSSHPAARSRKPVPDGDETRRLRDEVRRLRGEIRKTMVTTDVDVIPDPASYPQDMLDDWLRLAVRVMWARITDAATKRERPLPARWSVANGLGEKVASRADMAAILRRMVMILDGSDSTAHPWRDGLAGCDNAVGEWGNLVWRAYVKQGSPNAGRLHYTRDGGGNMVFLAVGGHDDLG